MSMAFINFSKEPPGLVSLSLRRAVIVGELLLKNRIRAVRCAGHSTSRCLIVRRTSSPQLSQDGGAPPDIK